MNIEQTKSTTMMCTLAILLTGCNASEPNKKMDMLVLGAALPQASESVQQPLFNDTNYVGTSDEELGYLAQVPDTQTASVRAYDDFAFDSSQSQTVSFSLPENSSHQAEATFCTEYTIQSAGSYQVDYDSCVLSTPVLGGTVNEELNLVNQYQSVIGVVSFHNPDIQPIYQEFHFD